MLKESLVHLLRIFFEDAIEPLQIYTPGIPLDEELEISIKISLKKQTELSMKDQEFEIELRLFETSQREFFEGSLAGFKNCPVIVPFSQLVETLRFVRLDYHIHWSCSIRSFSSAAQFVQACLVPFLDFDINSEAKTITPRLLPTPCSIIPEVPCSFNNEECYIGSYHVSENNVRLVLTSLGLSAVERNEPILMDASLDLELFDGLVELKPYFSSDDYQVAHSVLQTIRELRSVKFVSDSYLFKVSLRECLEEDIERQWLDIYVGCSYPAERGLRGPVEQRREERRVDRPGEAVQERGRPVRPFSERQDSTFQHRLPGRLRRVHGVLLHREPD